MTASDMPPLADPKTLSYDDWKAQAEKTLNGADLQSLNVVDEDGLIYPALYTASDRIESMDDALSARGAQSWVVAQYLEPEDDPSVLRSLILEELEGGTERLIFTADQNPYLLPGAVTGVMSDAISFSFDAPDNPGDAANAIITIWEEQKCDPELARGHLGIDLIADALQNRCADSMAEVKTQLWIDELMQHTEEWPKLGLFTAGGAVLHRYGLTAAQELAVNLAHVVTLMRMLEASGHSLEKAAKIIEVQIAMDADLYGAIAKARAARLILDKLYGSLGLDGTDIAKRLHGVTSDRMMSRLDLDTNMLRTGTAMLAMALSGLGVMTCLPHDWLVGSSAQSRRVARNGHHVLADEAGLSHVADPAQGSYYIDSASNALAEKSWQLFQEIEANGGVFKALTQGFFAKWAEAASIKRGGDVNQGHEKLLGITIHPTRHNVAASDLIQACVTGRAGIRGGNRRPSQPWEELRSLYQQMSLRCLMLDVGANVGAASDAERWFNAVGVDGAVMTAKDTAEARTIITSARPDVLVLGGGAGQFDALSDVIDEVDVKTVVDGAMFASTDDEPADLYQLLHGIYDVLTSEGDAG